MWDFLVEQADDQLSANRFPCPSVGQIFGADRTSPSSQQLLRPLAEVRTIWVPMFGGTLKQPSRLDQGRPVASLCGSSHRLCHPRLEQPPLHQHGPTFWSTDTGHLHLSSRCHSERLTWCACQCTEPARTWCQWRNRWATCRWRQNCPAPLHIMSLQRKGILWHDLLVSSEERRLTGQMNIGRMSVHRNCPNPRTSLFDRCRLNCCRPMSMDSCQLRKLHGLIRPLNASVVLSAPTGILDQSGPWHPGYGQPCRWHCDLRASHVDRVSCRTEPELQPVGI